MALHASGEDYLEAILVLHKKMGMVRSVDVARHMEVTKPSVCHAVATLRDGGFLRKADDCPQRSGSCQSSQGKLHFPCAGCRQLPLCGLAAREHLALQAVPVQQVLQ